MVKILKHYRKNIERNLNEAIEKEPKVTDDMEKRITAIFKHRGPVYGVKMSRGARESLAREIINELAGRNF